MPQTDQQVCISLIVIETYTQANGRGPINHRLTASVKD